MAQVRDGTMLVELDPQLRAGDREERHDRVGLIPRGRALVDEGEDEDAADLCGVVEVDEKGLAALAAAGAVIRVELDVGRSVELPERIAQRLHNALGAVGQLVERCEVEVDAAGISGHRAA